MLQTHQSLDPPSAITKCVGAGDLVSPEEADCISYGAHTPLSFQQPHGGQGEGLMNNFREAASPPPIASYHNHSAVKLCHLIPPPFSTDAPSTGNAAGVRADNAKWLLPAPGGRLKVTRACALTLHCMLFIKFELC